MPRARESPPGGPHSSLDSLVAESLNVAVESANAAAVLPVEPAAEFERFARRVTESSVFRLRAPVSYMPSHALVRRAVNLCAGAPVRGTFVFSILLKIENRHPVHILEF